MYHNNINLSLTFLSLLLIRNVFGAPEALSLAKNQTSATTKRGVSMMKRFYDKLDAKNDTHTKRDVLQMKRFYSKLYTENDTIAVGVAYQPDDPKFGELENSFC